MKIVHLSGFSCQCQSVWTHHLFPSTHQTPQHTLDTPAHTRHTSTHQTPQPTLDTPAQTRHTSTHHTPQHQSLKRPDKYTLFIYHPSSVRLLLKKGFDPEDLRMFCAVLLKSAFFSTVDIFGAYFTTLASNFFSFYFLLIAMENIFRLCVVLDHNEAASQIITAQNKKTHRQTDRQSGTSMQTDSLILNVFQIYILAFALSYSHLKKS